MLRPSSAHTTQSFKLQIVIYITQFKWWRFLRAKSGRVGGGVDEGMLRQN